MRSYLHGQSANKRKGKARQDGSPGFREGLWERYAHAAAMPARASAPGSGMITVTAYELLWLIDLPPWMEPVSITSSNQ